MVILSDSQQPTTLARLLINHHGCCKAIKNVAVLGTLYNLGHEKRGEGILGYIFGFDNAPRTPHSNPETNSFGNDVEAYYDLIGKLLESECVE